MKKKIKRKKAHKLHAYNIHTYDKYINKYNMRLYSIQHNTLYIHTCKIPLISICVLETSTRKTTANSLYTVFCPLNNWLNK